MASDSGLRVTVVYSPAPRQVHEINLYVAEPCSVAQALERSGLLTRFADLDMHHRVVGVWGRKVPLNQLLRDQDRIEVYRPLRVDPKVARRERFVKQGVRAAGLFVKKQARPKPGA